MDMDKVSTSEIIQAVHSYKFPMSEPIFSCPINNQNPSIAWLSSARPTDSKHYSIPSFWASSLYNCLEDLVLDEHFESIGSSSIWQPINIDIALKEITDLLTATNSSKFTVSGLNSCYRTLNSNGFGGIMGRDVQGLFTILWQSMPNPSIKTSQSTPRG